MNAGALSNYGAEVFERLVAAGYSERLAGNMTRSVQRGSGAIRNPSGA